MAVVSGRARPLPTARLMNIHRTESISGAGRCTTARCSLVTDSIEWIPPEGIPGWPCGGRQHHVVQCMQYRLVGNPRAHSQVNIPGTSPGATNRCPSIAPLPPRDSTTLTTPWLCSAVELSPCIMKLPLSLSL